MLHITYLTEISLFSLEINEKKEEKIETKIDIVDFPVTEDSNSSHQNELFSFGFSLPMQQNEVSQCKFNGY